MKLKTGTVRSKLLASFGMLFLLVLAVAAIALAALRAEHLRFAGYVNGIADRAAMAEQVRAAVDRRAIAARNLVLVRSEQDRRHEQREVEQAHADVQNLLGRLQQLTRDGAESSEQGFASTIGEVESRYGPVAMNIVQAALDGRNEAAIMMMNEQCRPLLAELIRATDAYAGHANGLAQAQIEESSAIYENRRNLVAGLCLAALIVAALLAMAMTRSLTRALGTEPGDLGAVARRVAEGNLAGIPGASAAPRGSVLASMGEMQAGLVRTLSRISASAEGVAASSRQIAQGNMDLSSRTEEQASSLAETASAVAQLAATVENTAQHAQHADRLVGQGDEIVNQNGEMMRAVSQQMRQISESSNKISEIIGVIEAIAFQTNILALNAAVEAARAGEQGKGFAVVAGEVRALAHKSATAAKEIKDLIGASAGQVEAGCTLAERAEKLMQQMAGNASEVARLIAEIARASREQSEGIGQINQAIGQIDAVTQQNAALVEETAAAAVSMQEQAGEQANAVAFFKFDASAPVPVLVENETSNEIVVRASLSHAG